MSDQTRKSSSVIHQDSEPYFGPKTERKPYDRDIILVDEEGRRKGEPGDVIRPGSALMYEYLGEEDSETEQAENILERLQELADHQEARILTASKEDVEELERRRHLPEGLLDTAYDTLLMGTTDPDYMEKRTGLEEVRHEKMYATLEEIYEERSESFDSHVEEQEERLVVLG